MNDADLPHERNRGIGGCEAVNRLTESAILMEKEGKMSTVTLEVAQTQLSELLERLAPGEEVVILREGKPVGRLLPPDPPKGVPVIGRGKGNLVRYVDDDEHLKDFAEYME